MRTLVNVDEISNNIINEPSDVTFDLPEVCQEYVIDDDSDIEDDSDMDDDSKLDQGCFIYQEASTSYSGWLASKSKDTSLGKRKFEISPEEKEQFSG